MYTIDAGRTATEKTTSNGIKYKIVDYITAKDLRYIEEPLYAGMEMKQKDGGQELSALKGTIVTTMQDRRFEVSIVSLDDNGENILERILNLRLADYNEIKAIVAEVTGEKKAQASPKQS